MPPSHSFQRSQWFTHHPLGQRVLQQEINALQQFYPQLFGYYLVQIGDVGQGQLLQNSRINHPCLVSMTDMPLIAPASRVMAQAEDLPFAADSIDAILLPHILEFADNPHAVLREIERVLIAEGHLIIIGFNPLSAWGAWHLSRIRQRHQVPWNAHLLGLARVKDWLSLLDLEVLQQHTCFFAPPLQSLRLMRHLGWMEDWGQCWLPQNGGIYLLLARKRRLQLPTMRPRWRLRSKDRRLVGAPSPTARQWSKTPSPD